MRLQKDNPTIRKIAKIFAKSLPVEDEEFGLKVNEFYTELMRLPKVKRNWLETAFIFASKVPQDEREDMLQEFTLTLLELKAKSPKLAYAAVRCDWKNWWQSYKTRSGFHSYSLNGHAQDADGNECELGELLVGECEFENRTIENMELRTLLNKMPEGVKTIVRKRLGFKGITKSDRFWLDRWVNKNWQDYLEVA